MKCGIIVEAGDVREVHQVALLVGYGASAINPYLAMETAEQLVLSGMITGITPEKAVKNVIKALGKGVLKIMSKMGISVVGSYAGAQAFEAIGLSQEFVDQYFTGTTSLLGGVGLDVIAAENAARHEAAYPRDGATLAHERLQVGGEYQWRREGPPHLFNPETVFKLQHSTRARRYDIFRDYTRAIDEQAENLMTLRGLFKLRDGSTAAGADRRGRVDRGDHHALQHRRDELRLDQRGGARDSRDRHEPHRRTLEHRRGRRRRRPSGRPRAAQPHQAGRERALRRHEHVPDERHRHPDQDGAGREARRGRAAAGRQGLPVDRAHPARHRRRRAHLAAAAPRHLLDRRPQAADLRPQAREPRGARAREARVAVGHRRGRGGRDEGAGGCRAGLRPRRRHGRIAPQLAEARGHAVGDRPRRDPADADAQRDARPGGRAGRRSDEDRVATSSSPHCSEPRSTASRPRRWWSPAAS